MACISPIKGYRSPDGKVRFTHTDAWVDRHVTIACGACGPCRLERARQWAVRITHESKLHRANSFITFTYDDKHLPPHGSLDKTDFQTYAQNVRNTLKKIAKETQTTPSKFRYFHCGEYGDDTGRPHYHAAIFGQDYRADRRVHKLTRSGEKLYKSELLQTQWGKGNCLIGQLTFQSASYVARYIMKKALGKDSRLHYETDQVDPATGEVIFLQPEYTTMSRRPGIGADWFSKFHTDVYPSDEVISNGHSARPPRFYDNLLEAQNPQLLETIKLQRKIAGSKHKSNNTPERLAVREKIHDAKMAQLKRKL